MPTIELPDRPGFPVLGDSASRVRGALSGLVTNPRQRMTLIIVLAAVGVLAMGAFAYLFFRRR